MGLCCRRRRIGSKARGYKKECRRKPESGRLGPKGKSSVTPACDRPEAATGTAAPPNRVWSTEQMGEVAGMVWHVLAERDGQSLAALKKAVDAPGDLVLAAVGWLARRQAGVRHKRPDHVRVTAVTTRPLVSLDWRTWQMGSGFIFRRAACVSVTVSTGKESRPHFLPSRHSPITVTTISR